MDSLTIRDALPEDAQQIAGLLEELGYPKTAGFARARIAELSKTKRDTLLVAETDGAVIGVAHLHIADLFHQPGRLGRIMAIVVTEDWRRLRVGRKLMEFAEAQARTAGCTRMELTSGVHRNGAHQFYESLGYTEKPRRFVKVLA